MANKEHLSILNEGVTAWNEWRSKTKNMKPDPFWVDLSEASLYGADLSNADLSKTNLYCAGMSEANLTNADLSKANLYGAKLREANLSYANLFNADLSKANLNGAKLYSAKLYRAKLREVNLSYADLSGADLSEVDLSGANLVRAILSGASLNGANLSEADLREVELSRAILIETNFEYANISGCRIFGVSAWKLKVDSATQSNLIITQKGEPEITVDNLEIAQFVYLLLHNAKLRNIIDTLTTKSVLILGRFTPERKAVLDAIREELRRKGYIPILFDFEKPDNRDLTETVMTLASLSRFVIADLSDPNSIPHELMSFADKLFSVPIQGIFCPVKEHPNPYPMYEHLRRLPHVLPIYRYETAEELIASLEEKVIKPAEEKVKTVRPIPLS